MMRSVCVAVLLLCMCQGAVAGPLYDYVHKPDPAYTWRDTGARLHGKGWTGYVLNMTSQTWVNSTWSNAYVWTHQLVVAVPDNLSNFTTGAIWVAGGENTKLAVPPVDGEDMLVTAALALSTGTIAAALFQIPNQPVVFANDPHHARRIEDAVMAWSWKEFWEHPNEPELLALMPMVKSVSAAMTTVTAFAKQHVNQHVVETFYIVGASKRGWTTWLTGGVDERVIAIAPIVMDMLDFIANVHHMYKAYGGWTWVFGDFYAVNFTQNLLSPTLEPLAAIIDPLMYKENLTMPKLVVDATGDEFFMPDDDQLWWGKLEGETYRLMIANADHTMITGAVPLLRGVTAFYRSVLENSKRPKLSWTIAEGNGTITATMDTRPTKAVLRQAVTYTEDRSKNGTSRRDFRLLKGNTTNDVCHFVPVKVFGAACLNPVVWIGEDVEVVQKGASEFSVTGALDMPPDGFWRGGLIDFYFPGPAPNMTYRFTTQVSIVPQTFPFEACEGTACKSFLV